MMPPRGGGNDWLGFLDAFRTICIDTPEEIRATFQVMRNVLQPL
jgi:hypothetical protein